MCGLCCKGEPIPFFYRACFGANLGDYHLAHLFLRHAARGETIKFPFIVLESILVIIILCHLTLCLAARGKLSIFQGCLGANLGDYRVGPSDSMPCRAGETMLFPPRTVLE